MKARDSKGSLHSPKKPSKKKSDSPLAICPVGGAGWCPYPFSPAQLKKRLEKMKANQQSEPVAAKKVARPLVTSVK
jgi:hypothetical protein